MGNNPFELHKGDIYNGYCSDIYTFKKHKFNYGNNNFIFNNNNLILDEICRIKFFKSYR